MHGFGRRTATACPWIAARYSLDTRVRVVELDLAPTGEPRSPAGPGADDLDGRVLAWVRLHGHPLALVHATGTPGDRAGFRRAPAAAVPHVPIDPYEPAVPTGHRTPGEPGPAPPPAPDGRPS
ncbi:hypothetical protein [Streptomyces ochraceiscleroticus]|uniref:hypothetical protein n=1 Tax=Streptomyces ochraceiscleroticus TaxID=47761 RepID=UPI0004C740EA|nr:hypothetical protein [Streptomyces ochraceiscleroticus]